MTRGTEIQASDQLRRLYKSWQRFLRDDGRGLVFVPLFGSLIRGGYDMLACVWKIDTRLD